MKYGPILLNPGNQTEPMVMKRISGHSIDIQLDEWLGLSRPIIRLYIQSYFYYIETISIVVFGIVLFREIVSSYFVCVIFHSQNTSSIK